MKTTKIMIVAVMLLSFGGKAQRMLQMNDNVYFALSSSTSLTELDKGFNTSFDFEYVNGAVYLKTGLQSFKKLEGGFTDIHFGMGVNLASTNLFEETIVRYYVGGRVANVKRLDEWKFVPALELGFQWNIHKHFFFGANLSLIKRYDEKVFKRFPRSEYKVYSTLGYRF